MPRHSKPIRVSQERPVFRAYFKKSHDFAAFALDLKGCVINWNAGAQAVFGYARTAVIGKPLIPLLANARKTAAHLRLCIGQSVVSDEFEGWWKRADGSQFWGQCVFTAMEDVSGVVTRFALIIRDLTALKRASEDQGFLTSLVENSEDAIIGKDLKGIVTKWNKAAELLFGYTREEIVGKPITVLFPPERLSEEKVILRRLRKGQRVHHYETVRVRKDGTLVDVSISVSPIKAAGGEIVGASKIARDITERKRIEAEREESMQMLRAVLEAATDAIIVIDQSGVIRSANPATEQLFGYSPSELMGRNVNCLMPQPFQREHDGYIKRYCQTGRAKIIGVGREVSGIRKDGSQFPMHLSVSEVYVNGARLFAGIVHDLTGRRNLERQIMETAANEQRRIGQDLHDGLCQDLVGVAFRLDDLSRRAGEGAASQDISRVAGSVRQAATQARRLAHGLNPVDLQAGGLSAALAGLAARISTSFSVQCRFVWDEVARIMDDSTATHLYRIAQEAVGNALRHGKATKVRVELRQRNDVITLSIIDNGVGVKPGVSDSVKQGVRLSGKNLVPTGIGLQTMNYRARIIGGSLAIHSGKTGGTVVTCTVGREHAPVNHQWSNHADRSSDSPHARKARRP